MKKDRRKQLIEEYRNRTREIGVLSFRCMETGESFLGIAKDLKADINSLTCKLNSNFYPNKKLLALWNQYGEAGFEITLLKKLKNEDPTKDYTIELEDLRDKCLEEDPNSMKIWR